MVAAKTSYQLAPPEPFTFSSPEEWPKWIQRFEWFHYTTELYDEEEKMQINTLIYTMGNEVENVLYSYQLSEDDLKKYHMKKFESHFVKRRMQHLKGRNSKETGVR